MEAKTRTTPSDLQLEVSSDDKSENKAMSGVRADFNGLLELAEKLQHSYEEQIAKRQSASITIQVYGLFFILALLAAFVSINYLIFDQIRATLPHFNHATNLFGLTCLVAAMALGTVTFWYIRTWDRGIRQIERHMKADARDLTEVVELLREIEPVYAKEEKLSALERVQIRIRLSRFGIGSSSRSDAENTAKDMKSEFQSRKSRVDQELMKPF